MKEKMIVWLVGTVLERIGEEDVRKWVQMGITMLRKKIVESENKYDDMIILPMLKVLEDLIDGE